jgi:hypothetical protein
MLENIRDDLTVYPQKKIRIIERRNKEIDIFRSSVENLSEIGFGVVNAKKKTVQGLSTPLVLADILGGVSPPILSETNSVTTRLTSAGIRINNDRTFIIDELKLKRALEVNSDEILKIFTDKKSGILPLLSEQLENLLRENLGDLDQKITQVAIETKSPDFSKAKVNQFTDISRLDKTVKNLITVV